MYPVLLSVFENKPITHPVSHLSISGYQVVFLSLSRFPSSALPSDHHKTSLFLGQQFGQAQF